MPRRADLERFLESVPRHPSPSPDLEQYRTPPGIAASLLMLAHQDGAIAGRRVLDLGCGTGTFSFGAAKLGARDVLGVDVDAVAVREAETLAKRLGLACHFEVEDLASWEPPAADTVVMNPPFGAQKGNKHADRAFLDCATRANRLAGPGSTTWFLALERTEGFLQAWARSAGASIEKVGRWDYPLEATMAHHREAVRTIEVGGYRLAP